MSILIFTGPSCCACNAWSKICLLHQAVMFQCLNTGHAVLTSANPEIHKTKQCLCTSLLRRLPLPCCRILLFSQRKQLQPRPFYCVVCCCWCQIWVGLCLFSISIRKKRETEICIWDTLGLAPVMWCSWHLNQACGGTETILFYVACCWWRLSLHNICTHMYIYIYTHLYICMCFFTLLAEKRTRDSRCTTLAWTSCLDIRSSCNNNFFNFFRPFHPFSCQWAVLYTRPCILPRLCHVVGCRQSWGTAGWGRGKDLCTSMFHLSFLLPPL